MHKAFDPRDDIDRLHVSKKKKEDEDSPVLKIAQMHQYGDVRTTLKRAQKDLFFRPIATQTTEQKQKQNLGNRNRLKKQLYEYCKRQIGEISHEKSWT